MASLRVSSPLPFAARGAPEQLSPEVGISALSAGASLPRDREVVVAALEAIYVLAPKLRNLWAGQPSQTGLADRLALVAGDLVRLGEVRHKAGMVSRWDLVGKLAVFMSGVVYPG